ncbi:N(5)-(carboxyethyl)ornithine synthase [Bariatricus sp. SGI.154]|uniref:N(5)-(carboxyethyl)ornithine synthase n=1 Tax=Bariatricus sp. SGI.154 TaxID=3420549 RepID=UPI003D07A498
MKTIAFPISHKENENRRAIVPEHIVYMKNPANLYFERGYGRVLGIEDEKYIECGCNICSHEECLNKDIICDPKVGDADYLEKLTERQTIFGWVHATQNKEITDILIKNKLTAYAWERMYFEGRHVFWRNNELAGEAAVLHAFQCYAKMPYETKVAVLGRGNTARGVIKILNMLGADVIQYDRKTEKLLRKEIVNYDVIVNCVLWDVMRTDHIIYKDDLKKMKRGSMIIDVSCDKNGGIETSIPTTIESPTYLVDDILHYVVDHTPTLYYKTFSLNNSEIIYPYLEELVVDEPGKVLKDAMIVSKGDVIDSEINMFQRR